MPDLETLTFWGCFALLLQVAIVAGVTLRVMLTRHPPGSSFAWILITTVLPYAGFFLYLAFGERPIGKFRAKRLRKVIGTWFSLSRQKLTPTGPLPRPLVRHRTLIHLATRVAGLPLSTGSRLKLCPDARSTVESLLADIRAARESVLMTFYIWSSGGVVDEVTRALLEAHRRGVAVKILLDDFGARNFLNSAEAAGLRSEGIEIARALPMRLLAFFGLQRADLRLHRKLVVIDEHIAYTGSFNMIDPASYDAAAVVGSWVDAMVRIEGPAVNSLYAVWRFDWALQPESDLENLQEDFSMRDLPNVGEASTVTITSGPYQDAGNQNLALVTEVIARAEHSLTITTPYFVPGEAVVQALINAELRGVDVKLILPRHADSRAVEWASRRYFDDLLRAGVRILYYEGGLLHTKSISVDDEFAVFGTLNIDNRSMHLNFELMMLIFDAGFMADINRLHADYESRCVPLELERWQKRPVTERLKEGACYLVSPLL